MPIYKEQRSGARHQSIRVAVGVGGKLRQKSFSLKGISTEQEINVVEKMAQELEQTWQDEAKKVKQQKNADAKPLKNSNSTADSGVRGIKMKWRRRETGARMHYSPMFLVSVTEGTRQCGIIDAGHKKGWKKAVNAYCEFKGVENQASLLKRMPPKSKWDDVRQYYINKFGWDIPLNSFKD